MTLMLIFYCFHATGKYIWEILWIIIQIWDAILASNC